MDFVRVKPNQYIHVHDTNKNTTRVVSGPCLFTRNDSERVTVEPKAMVVIPQSHYVMIKDPAERDDAGVAQLDKFGQVKLRHGDMEVRFKKGWEDPFPLLPGEIMVGGVKKVPFIKADSAFRIKASRNFTDGKQTVRRAGDEWLIKGPATYYPRCEEEVVAKLQGSIIFPQQALMLKADREFTENGITRKAGEQWLVTTPGAYIPNVAEKVIGIVNPIVITNTSAVHLKATNNFKDCYGVERKAGETWLVTNKECKVGYHIPDVYEVVVRVVEITTLSQQQYCVIIDPMGEDGHNRYGEREVRRGPLSFFVRPNESMPDGKQDIFILSADEALLLTATEVFKDPDCDNKERGPGEVWLKKGPAEYFPPVQVKVVEHRNAIPLDKNEGIYVRNVVTGEVRVECDKTYMLTANEELWQKKLPDEVEKLLRKTQYEGLEAESKRSRQRKRDKTRVVSYRVPHNAAVSIYDYKKKEARVIYGPELVMLSPDEEFTVVRLSGGKPKKPNQINSLSLMLGPDFMTDVVEVETSDHARLRLQLSYNWHFEVDKTSADPAERAKVFKVRDFVGDACQALASRVRGAVASTNFDEFHKYSAKIIRTSIFGVDDNTNKIGNVFRSNNNGLIVTNVDIQTVQPVDDRTRDSLQQSVQSAISITTRKQARHARVEADEIKQKALGKIEGVKISNATLVETERQVLEALISEVAAIRETGTATAEAAAKAEYMEIEVKADVEKAMRSAEAEAITMNQEIANVAAVRQADLEYQQKLANLDLEKEQALSLVESKKFEALVTAISPQTIKAIARAGPELQARLLKGLGLKGYLLTDGNSPVNLFNTAKGMTGQ